ncbi:MAG: creatininase family protein [Thermoproteales archaeon]|nr:creatininase family protein [Thermoproteales archaeon]RLE64769.1 MAG: creatininase family protein [Thermoprotei archaeon]
MEYESRFARPVYNKFGEKIYFDQMTMAEILERVKKNDIIMVPCGSIESHGLAQATGEDTLIGTYIAERVAFETGITVAPPIFYGSHPSHHYGMPGTIPIKKEAYIDYVVSVVKWLSNTGFKKIILFNSHGQEYVLPIAKDKAIIDEGVHALIMVTSWWAWVRDLLQVGRELKPGVRLETPFIHADELEASVLWYVAPKLVDVEKLKESDAEKMVGVIPDKWVDKAGNVYSRPFSWFDVSHYMEIHHYPKGSVGYPSKASKEKGEVIVEEAIKRIIEFVEWLKEKYPPGVVPKVWPEPGDFKY